LSQRRGFLGRTKAFAAGRYLLLSSEPISRFARSSVPTACCWVEQASFVRSRPVACTRIAARYRSAADAHQPIDHLPRAGMVLPDANYAAAAPIDDAVRVAERVCRIRSSLTASVATLFRSPSAELPAGSATDWSLATAVVGRGVIGCGCRPASWR
jgi:hypothetical protein